ncbi:hypothetical protein GSY74_09610 [Sulfurovum sp. bin170]|uniref:hypothetical protein n=1 Tax=Sulfurovum sp. bin170 TaxID=2695268 RepID=UPI0013DF7D42|nr:hypothetical protein [Sulfurovum sp. bin170]NEW61538.1 hypothetical protein [Sulfurovum sp. bin170]
MIHKLVLIFILFIYVGCGLMSQPKKDEKGLQIPEKISVDMPEALSEVSNSKKIEKIKVPRIEGDATRYEKVKEYISEVEAVVNEIKSNLFLGNHIIADIEKQCKDVTFEKICTIPKGTLSLIVTQEVLDKLKLLVPNVFEYGDTKSLKGEELFFGIVEFMRHDENSTYQYSLQMDMSSLNGRIAFYDTKKAPKIIQVIKWSEDTNTIFSSITTKYESGLDFPWTLQYYNKPELEESMHLNDRTIGNADYPSTNRLFSLTNQYDENDTAIVKLNSIESQETNFGDAIEQVSSFIKLTKEMGVQKFTQTNTLLNSYKKLNREEVFDGDGLLLATTYCDTESSECQLYDSSTWYSDAEDESIFDALAEVNFEELKIVDGNLKEGEYFLLPLGYDIAEMTAQQILELRVGEFTILDETRQGVLYDINFMDKLGELELVYAKYNDNLDALLCDKSRELFEVIKDEDLPQISLWRSE